MSQIVNLPLEEIRENPNNPRAKVNPKDPEFVELKNSIQGIGVKVEVRVRETDKGYELLAGSRRMAAARELGLKTIPAVNEGKLSDQEAFEITFAENYKRKDLSILEQARAVEILMAKYNGDAAAVASKLGWERKKVLCRARISRMAPSILKRLERGDFDDVPVENLDLVARLPVKLQEEFEKRHNLGGPITHFRAQIKEYEHALDAAPWFKEGDLVVMVKGLSDCTRCDKRTDHKSLLSLFHDEGDTAGSAKCLDPVCWKKNETALVTARLKEAQKAHGNDLCVVFDAEHGDYNEQYRARENGAQIIQGVKGVKEGTPGSKPVFVLNGPKTGEIVHYKKERPADGEQGRGRPPEAPKSMKERREGLESKRWSHILGRVVEKLDALAQGKSLVSVTPDAKGGIDDSTLVHMIFVAGVDNEDPAKDTAIKDESKILQALLERVAASFSNLLTWSGPITALPAHYIKLAKYVIAKVLRDSEKAFYTEAVEKIPEPKSWAGLKADGTPKEEKDAAKKA